MVFCVSFGFELRCEMACAICSSIILNAFKSQDFRRCMKDNLEESKTLYIINTTFSSID